MKVAFFSNFLNHHQIEICNEFIKITNNNFKFVATEEIPNERLKLGYDDMNIAYDFVVRTYENQKQFDEAIKIALEYDIVIIGNAPSIFIKGRTKLTFRYSERIFKSGFNIKDYLSIIKNISFKERRNYYLLCSSAYAKHDYNIAGAYLNRCYKWGYFPKTLKYNIKNLLDIKLKNKRVELVWVSRFISWKHPEKVIEVARRLSNENIDFNITMVGTGELYLEVQKMIDKYHLNSFITLTGAVNNKDVRAYMEKANIFLFTSDYNEGWGAVLNESMNSGCAVVASNAIGAVPYLIENGENGLIYDDSNMNDFYSKVKSLIVNKELQYFLGLNAYKTISEIWNAENAVKNLITLSEEINLGIKKSKIEIGPCSMAYNIKNQGET